MDDDLASDELDGVELRRALLAAAGLDHVSEATLVREVVTAHRGKIPDVQA